jgi:hypothetical protein
MEWKIAEVLSKTGSNLKQRTKVATEVVRNKVVKNISKGVERGVGPRSGRKVVTQRSKPGEYPRSDTGELMRTILPAEVREERPGVFVGYVGTPLDYGLILEMRMNRSFLVRTLYEESDKVKRIITQRIT